MKRVWVGLSLCSAHRLHLHITPLPLLLRARLVVGSVAKDPANPLMREDRPWEPRWDNV